MKTYKTLMKISQQELDLKRRDLNLLLDRREELLRFRKQLERQLRNEQEICSNSPESSFAYANFALRVGAEQELAEQEITGLEGQIETMTEAIIEAFAELKKYDILVEKMVEEEKFEEDKRLQVELDEIGLTSYVRKDVNN